MKAHKSIKSLFLSVLATLSLGCYGEPVLTRLFTRRTPPISRSIIISRPVIKKCLKYSYFGYKGLKTVGLLGLIIFKPRLASQYVKKFNKWSCRNICTLGKRMQQYPRIKRTLFASSNKLRKPLTKIQKKLYNRKPLKLNYKQDPLYQNCDWSTIFGWHTSQTSVKRFKASRMNSRKNFSRQDYDI